MVLDVRFDPTLKGIKACQSDCVDREGSYKSWGQPTEKVWRTMNSILTKNHLFYGWRDLASANLNLCFHDIYWISNQPTEWTC